MKVKPAYWKAVVCAAKRDGTDCSIRLTPEDSDDIWVLYNILESGDEVEAPTTRKVLHESSSGEVTGSQRLKMVLSIKVEKCDVDLLAGQLRVNGLNTKENQHVKLGSYHTLQIEPHGPDEPDYFIRLTKERWDGLAIAALEQCLNSAKDEIGAVLMEPGLSSVVLHRAGCDQPMVLHRVQVPAAVPKKKGPGNEKAIEKYISETYAAMRKYLVVEKLKAIIVGSTEATLRDEIYRRLLSEATETKDRNILDNKNKFLRLQVKSGQPSALSQALDEPRIALLLADTRTAHEKKLLDAFQKHLTNAEDNVDLTAFGTNQVLYAAEQGAIKDLLLADSLFRSTDIRERRTIAKVAETAARMGAKVTVFSPNSRCAEELEKLSGIAAILNFALFPND